MQEISRQLIEQAAAGDVAAFEDIYRQTARYVYLVVLGILRNPADAQEATQDVFVKVYQHLKSFSFRSSFKTWLYRISVNTALSVYRQKRKHQAEASFYREELGGTLEGEQTTGVTQRQEGKMLLEAVLQDMRREYKECLLLREIEGYSYQEIASILGIPINTVRSRLRRARQALLQIGKRCKPDEV